MISNQSPLKQQVAVSNIGSSFSTNSRRSALVTRFALPSLLLFLAACVTINVYFPEAAASKAADSVVCEVLGTCNGDSTGNSNSSGDETGDIAKPAPQQQTVSDQPSGFSQRVVAAVGTMLNGLVPAAYAQADLDVDSAGARKLRSGMEQRQQQMRPYLDSGAVGFTNGGLVEVRDLGAVSLPQRAKLRQLVAAENKDRSELYAEIARINGHAEWLGKIQAAFADRWIARAGKGWYYQNGSGNWVQK